MKETKEQSYILGKEIQSEAQKNITYIRNDAKSLALTEAEKKVNDAFKEKNIQKVIDEMAKREIESRVKEIVDEQMKQSPTLILVMLSTDRIKAGDRKAFMFVDSIAQYSKDFLSKSKADSIRKMKAKDYDDYYPAVTSIKRLNEVGCSYDDNGGLIQVDSTASGMQKRFEYSKSAIANSDDLGCVAEEFEVLRFITRKPIKMFDFDAVKKLQFSERKNNYTKAE